MSSRRSLLRLSRTLLALCLAGCAIHPPGEREERDRALEEGQAFEPESRPPPLDDGSGLTDYLQHAFHASSALRRSYWEWRAALERIPQEASPPDPALSFSYLIGPGGLSTWDRTTLGLQNMPSKMIPPPSKLDAAGRRALERARAAGLRFESERFRIQREVKDLYQDLAFHGELMRLQQQELDLIELRAAEAELALETGRGSQQDLLRARTERDLSADRLDALHADLPPLIGRLNVLVGRPPLIPIPLPALPAPTPPLELSEGELLQLAAERSPELAALQHEVAAGEWSLELARLQGLPDFGFALGLTGSLSASLGGMLTLPLRREAIAGAIAEARAELEAAHEAQVQYGRDLAAAFVLDLFLLRNVERRIELFDGTLLPRAELLARTARADYETSRGALPGLIDAELTLLDTERTLAMLRTEREKVLDAIETWSAVDVGALHPVRRGMR